MFTLQCDYTSSSINIKLHNTENYGDWSIASAMFFIFSLSFYVWKDTGKGERKDAVCEKKDKLWKTGRERSMKEGRDR